MVDYQTISIVLTGIGIIVAIVYYAQVLRNTSKARQRELIFLRFQSFDREWARAWTNVLFNGMGSLEEWQKYFHPTENPDNFTDMIFIQTRYQNLGLMLKEKVMEPELLFRIYQPRSIMIAWEHYEDNIKYRRETSKNPTLLDGFEYLYNETKNRYPDINTDRAIDRH